MGLEYPGVFSHTHAHACCGCGLRTPSSHALCFGCPLLAARRCQALPTAPTPLPAHPSCLQTQCVHRFLSLPIEDSLLDELEQGPAAPGTLHAPPSAAATASAPHPTPSTDVRIPAPLLVPDALEEAQPFQQQSQPQLQPSLQAGAAGKGSSPPANGGVDGTGASTSPEQLAQLVASACAGDAAARASIEEYVLQQVELPFVDSPNPLMAQVRRRAREEGVWCGPREERGLQRAGRPPACMHTALAVYARCLNCF